MDTETKYGYYDPDGDVNWFPPYTNPLDSMPVATTKTFDWEDTAPSEYEPPHEEPPRPEEEIADWFDESDDIEATKTLHQEMYELATKNGTTLTLGGSENASRL